MLTAIKLVVIVGLIGGVQSARADEVGDAVQVLSNLWKGTFDSQKGPIATEFLGDGKTFKMRRVAYLSDGTVTVLDAAASFRFLEIADDSLGYLAVACVPTSGCIFVRCLYKRDCISIRQNTYDPVYNDPNIRAPNPSSAPKRVEL